MAGGVRKPDSDTAQIWVSAPNRVKYETDPGGGADHEIVRNSVIFAADPDKAYFR
jgi:hypothetical protein